MGKQKRGPYKPESKKLKKSVMVNFTESQFEILAQRADEEGLPLATLVRNITMTDCDAYFLEKDEQKPKTHKMRIKG